MRWNRGSGQPFGCELWQGVCGSGWQASCACPPISEALVVSLSDLLCVVLYAEKSDTTLMKQRILIAYSFFASSAMITVV